MKPDSETKSICRKQNIPYVRESAPKYSDKLEQIRRKYMSKISAQPEGYRQQLIASLEGKHQIHPTLQEELAAEWGLKNAGDT